MIKNLISQISSIFLKSTEEQLKESEYKKLQELEESLWRSETRFDFFYQQKIFAKDLFEFGRSGRVYNRDQLIDYKIRPIKAKLPLENFKITYLNKNNVLVTYISEVQLDVLEKSNRCSVWSKTENGWQLRFHQGTPVCD